MQGKIKNKKSYARETCSVRGASVTYPHLGKEEEGGVAGLRQLTMTQSKMRRGHSGLRDKEQVSRAFFRRYCKFCYFVAIIDENVHVVV